MSGNKYLEKIALNAFKARAMAKSVGLIADHTSQWKWALRNMRDGRGNALAGKALSDAKRKIGSVSNNTYQRVSSTAKHQNSGIEVGGRTTNGNISKIDVGTEPGSLRFSDRHTNGSTVHTHPGSQRIIRGAKADYSITRPSGQDYFNQKKNRITQYRKLNGQKDQVDAKMRHLEDMWDQGHEPDAKVIRHGMRIQRTLNNEISQHQQDFKHAYDWDVRAFSHYGKNNTHSIISPEYQAEGVHRIKHDNAGIPLAKRTIYFNRAPRTTFTDNL